MYDNNANLKLFFSRCSCYKSIKYYSKHPLISVRSRKPFGCFRRGTSWAWLASLKLQPVDTTCTNVTILIPTIKNPTDSNRSTRSLRLSNIKISLSLKHMQYPWHAQKLQKFTSVCEAPTHKHGHARLTDTRYLLMYRLYCSGWAVHMRMGLCAACTSTIHQETLPLHHHSRKSKVTENPETSGCWLSAWPEWLWLGFQWDVMLKQHRVAFQIHL